MCGIIDLDHLRTLTTDEEFKVAEEHVTMMISQYLKDTGKMPIKFFISKNEEFSSLYYYAGILYELDCHFVDKSYSWMSHA